MNILNSGLTLPLKDGVKIIVLITDANDAGYLMTINLPLQEDFRLLFVNTTEYVPDGNLPTFILSGTSL